MYGFATLDPEGGAETRSGEIEFNLTKEQCARLINKLLKNPGYGYGKEEAKIKENINKIINQIKKTYV